MIRQATRHPDPTVGCIASAGTGGPRQGRTPRWDRCRSRQLATGFVRAGMAGEPV